MATKTTKTTKTTDTIGAGQLARVINPRHHAYGRIGRVTGGTRQKRVIRFVDLPPNIANQQTDPTGLVAKVASNELALIAPIPMAAFYLIVTITERYGDRRYTQCCLAHGKLQNHTNFGSYSPLTSAGDSPQLRQMIHP